MDHQYSNVSKRTFKKWLADNDAASRQRRSGLGAVVTFAMLPVLLGVMGCFEVPAPVGDPERSRIEPAISGAWVTDATDISVWMLIFEPYDKRTWLGRLVVIEETMPDLDSEEGDIEVAEELETRLDLLRAGRLQVGGTFLMKVWRKRFSGQSFLTFEFRGMVNEGGGMSPGAWWVAKARVNPDDRLELMFIDKEFEDIEEGITRSQLERIVRRNIDNPDLYSGDTGPIVYERVPTSAYPQLNALLTDGGVGASYE